MPRTMPLFLACISMISAGRLPAQTVEHITAEQAAARVRAITDRPGVIVFYATDCPLSQAMFPSLVALAREQTPRGVTFLVFSVDKGDPSGIPGFLARYRAPFSATYVTRWAPGAFTRTMASLGIEAGASWTTPLVAVRDRSGRIVTQGQGVTDVSSLSRVLSGRQ